MRKILPFLATGLLAVAAAGCGGKKDSDTIIAQKTVRKTVSAPVRMQDYTQTKELEFGGSRMTSKICRTADDSLATVTDDTGQKFIDNRIRLVITRSDGSVFLEKTFTKKTFDSYLDDDYRKTGILEGLVFDKVDGGSIKFAASVSHPQTDEYIPLVVSVSRTGTISFARDSQLDTSAGDDDEI